MTKPNFPYDDIDFTNDLEARVRRLERSLGYQKIGDFTVSGLTATYAAIPQGFSHLRVVFIGQVTRPSFPNTGLRFNFSTAAGAISSAWSFNYWGYGNGTGGVIQGQVTGDSRGYLGQTPAANRANDNYVSHGVIDIPFYSLGNTVKSFLVNMTTHDGVSLFQGMLINNTNISTAAAITALSIFDDANSNLGPRMISTPPALYGIL